MDNEILKEQIEMAINNLNSNDEKDIKEINDLIEGIDNEELKSELAILFTLKQVELSNQKEIVSKPVANKSKKKLDVKVLIFAGALGILSIAAGIKLANRDNNTNGISTSYSQESNNEQNKSGLFEKKVYHTDVIFDDSIIGPQGFENTYEGTQREFDVHFGFNMPNTDSSIIEYHTCRKNYNHDYNEALLMSVKQYLDDNGISINEMHHYTKEEREEIASIYYMGDDTEQKAILRECKDDLEQIYLRIYSSVYYNDGFNAWLMNKDVVGYNRSLTLLFSSGLFVFYPEYFERDIEDYMVKNNCSEQEAWDAAKEEFLNGDPSVQNNDYFSPYQIERAEDYKYTIFCQYVNEVGLDQFKEDFIYLFDENYYKGYDGKVYTK